MERASEGVPSRATMAVPSWLGGENPTGFLAEAGLYAKATGDGLDYQIQTDERRLRVSPSLVTVENLIGPNAPRDRLDQLDRMAKDAPVSLPSLDEIDVNARLERVRKRGGPVAGFSEMVIRTMAAPPGVLSKTVRDAYYSLKSTGTTENPQDKLFANAGVHLVRRSMQLVHRAKLPSIGLRMIADARLARGETAHLISGKSPRELIFGSSEGLNSGFYMMDAYLGPLFGAITPFVWAFPAIRTFGTIVYSLGCPLAGASGEAGELLQLLSQQGTDKTTDAPTVSARASAEAIQWWVARLNSMFGVLSDPAIHVDEAGRYDPAKHLRALMNVEQLFRRVYSIQGAHRDANARRVLLFTVLDTLHRLTGRDLVTHCRPSFAEKTLANLRSVISMPAAEILIPAAERAVTALREIKLSFFIGYDADNDRLVLRHRDGREESIPGDNATSMYVELLRNATHGYGTTKGARVGRSEALLAQHNGRIDHDLPLVGYLYLLDILVNPEVLRRVLFNFGRP